jgi:hypothetical protein
MKNQNSNITTNMGTIKNKQRYQFVILLRIMIFFLFTVSYVKAQTVTATGGTVTTSGLYTIHTFTSSGTFSVSSGGTVEYLVIGGGGGGGFQVTSWSAGGGGAGGVLAGTISVSALSYPVTVGAGGGSHLNGSNSIFNGQTALGGGRGGNLNENGALGGSGGGGGSSNAIGGTGTAGQGSAGGNTTGGSWQSAGGGGAGGIGGSSLGGQTAAAGNGGIGISSSISGISQNYAGGGGAGGYYSSGTASHGGGAGGAFLQNGNSATANTGSGGGGAGDQGGVGGNGGSGIVIIRYLTAGPVPIDLLDFTAILNNNKVNLNWRTATEINNNYFTVERSKDGINFEFVAKVQGAGNSTTTKQYVTLDEKPYQGLSFYRLKQTDFDGKFNYSKIVYINFKKDISKEVTIYPNPVTNELNMEIPGNTEPLNFEIISLTGAVVYKGSINEKTRVQTSSFAPGTYLIKFANDHTSGFKKVIKQ